MKILLSFPVSGISGSTGADPEKIYYIHRGQQVARSRGTPNPGSTPSQLATRAVFADAVASWDLLTNTDRSRWDALALQRSHQMLPGSALPAGRSLFLSSFINSEISGKTLPDPPSYSPTPAFAIEILSAAMVPPLPDPTAEFQVTFNSEFPAEVKVNFVVYVAGIFPSASRNPRSCEWRLVTPVGQGASYVPNGPSQPRTFVSNDPWIPRETITGGYVWIMVRPFLSPVAPGLETRAQFLLS